jgi:hypothetical protein
MRTTSTGGAFKKVHQVSKTGKNTPSERSLMYVDEVELTEIAAYDDTHKYRQLEPSKMQNYKEDDQVQLVSSGNTAS